MTKWRPARRGGACASGHALRHACSAPARCLPGDVVPAAGQPGSRGLPRGLPRGLSVTGGAAAASSARSGPGLQGLRRRGPLRRLRSRPDSLMSSAPMDQFKFIEQVLQTGRKLTVKSRLGSSQHRAEFVSGSEHGQISRLKTARVLRTL